MKTLNLRSLLSDIKLFIQTVFDLNERATKIIKKEADDETDNFLLLCFSDLLGIPSPTSYYSLELLPYLSEELESWETRILGRKSILEDKASIYDSH